MKKLIVILVLAVLLAGCDSRPRWTDYYKEVDDHNLALAERNDARTQVKRLTKLYNNEKEWSNDLEGRVESRDAEIVNIKVLHAIEISDLKEKHLKATLIKPTDAWLELHGNDLKSYQMFNTRLLLDEARKKPTGIPTPAQ